MSDPILLSKREAARSLSISVRTLDGLIGSNEIPVRRIGRRVLIARRYLEQFAFGKKTRKRVQGSAPLNVDQAVREPGR